MSEAAKSVTGAVVRPGPVSPPKPAGDPRDAELDSLRRILAEKDSELATAGQKIRELEENSVTPDQLAQVRAEMAQMRASIAAPVAAAPQKEPAGWEGALKAEGFVDRPETPTAGVENPLPEGFIYRLTAPATYPPDHVRAGELSYNGLTCVHLGSTSPRPNAPGEAARQYCIKFENGLGLTDDKEVAWQMANDFGYGLDIETKPVIKYEARPEEFKPILKPRTGPRGSQLSEKERLVAAG